MHEEIESEQPSTDHRVIIVGMRGVGKFSVSRLLALSIGAQWVDADQLFVTKHGGISNFFAEQGEAAFRPKKLRSCIGSWQTCFLGFCD